MRSIVFAPDGFKGSISAADAATALAEGWNRVHPDDAAVLRPVADGGEGTLDAFLAAVPGSRRIPVEVTGPHGEGLRTQWLLLPDGTGVVELAGTAGIELLHGDLQPFEASTLGFGQAIAAALAHGVARLVLGIGSSASTDGGVGMLAALGAHAADAAGRPVAAGLRGLDELAVVDLSGLLPTPPAGVVVLTDVTNPLVGARGAAAVFGPQKGLDEAGVRHADAALRRLAPLLGVDPQAPGAGAAGAPARRCSPGARTSFPAPRRSPASSRCPRRWPRHPSW